MFTPNYIFIVVVDLVGFCIKQLLQPILIASDYGNPYPQQF